MTGPWRRALLAAPAAALLIGVLATPSAQAAEWSFGQPSAEGELPGPIVFRTSLAADHRPRRVDALLTFPGGPAVTVIAAEVTGSGQAWSAEATLEGPLLANTLIEYQFRASDDDGPAVLGPAAEILVDDDRFEWRTLSGPVVRLHWYEGDDAFGRRALEIGERAVDDAAALLGVTETELIDFFIYADEASFYDALGGVTRENVGGLAVPELRTMYGLISPSQLNEDWVDIVVGHELTHLVFDTATRNIYRLPAHWLDEGVATYLSEGNSARWQSTLDFAISTESLTPLQGLGGNFGAGPDRFDLGYAESVSAVDFFVDTYGEPKLWELVRSYAAGLSDDDAFTRATGGDVAAFNSAWMRSIGADVPAELGPQPGPTGPLPPDWVGLPPATPGPVVTPGEQRPTARPVPTSPPGLPAAGSGPSTAVMLGILLVTVAAVLAAVWLVARRSRRRQPPPWYGPDAGPPPDPPAGPPDLPTNPPPPSWPSAG